MGKPEFDITHATIRYAVQCIQEGDWHALRDMGFGPRECEAITRLTMADLAALEKRVSGHALTVKLNVPLFWEALEDIEQETTQQDVLSELIRRDAPLEMVNALFGVREKIYTRLRRRFDVSTGVGRPTELPQDAVFTLSEILNRFDLPLSPADWLIAAEESGLSFRAMWREYQRWQTLSSSPLPDKSGRDGP